MANANCCPTNMCVPCVIIPGFQSKPDHLSHILAILQPAKIPSYGYNSKFVRLEQVDRIPIGQIRFHCFNPVQIFLRISVPRYNRAGFSGIIPDPRQDLPASRTIKEGLLQQDLFFTDLSGL